MATGSAQGQRCIAPTIEEHHGLGTSVQFCLDGIGNDGRQPMAPGGRIGAHINGFNVRQFRFPMAVHQMDPRVTPGLGVHDGL